MGLASDLARLRGAQPRGSVALCTHRPSLLPIEWLSEAFGLAPGGRQRPPRAGKFVKLGHLEEVKVVTRFLWNTHLYEALVLQSTLFT